MYFILGLIIGGSFGFIIMGLLSYSRQLEIVENFQEFHRDKIEFLEKEIDYWETRYWESQANNYIKERVDSLEKMKKTGRHLFELEKLDFNKSEEQFGIKPTCEREKK